MKFPQAKEIIQNIRGKKIGFVFQDPQTSLNPLFKIKDQLIETIQAHLNLSYQDSLKKSIQLLKEVGIENAEKRIEDYPHQFSGGMRQRVVIALAISCEPDLIIADEPTTALSLIETQKVFDFVNNIKAKGRSVLFIGHNIFHVYDISDRFVILDRGRIVHQLEKADVDSPENLIRIMKETVEKGE